jgi:hemolysin-activating ACP:hemolysin acyltransferase
MTSQQPPTDAPGPSGGEARRLADAAHRFQQTFGAVVTILLHNPPTRSMPLAELEKLILPGIMNGQVIVAEAQARDTGFAVPIAFALWATVSPAVDQRLSAELDKPPLLEAAEWKSGDIPWLIVAVGDPRTVGTLAHQVQQSMLGGRPIKLRVMGEDGRPAVKTLTAPPGG